MGAEAVGGGVVGMSGEGGLAVVLVAVEAFVGRVAEEGGEPFARGVAGEVRGVADVALVAELVAVDAGEVFDDDFATGGDAFVEVGHGAERQAAFGG